MAKNNTKNIILTALLANPTVKAAAISTGISEGCIYKHLRDPTFREDYEQAKLEMLEQSTASLQINTQKAVNAIISIIEDTETAPQVKLNASDMLIRNSLKMTEQVEILRRLEKLEQAQKEDI